MINWDMEIDLHFKKYKDNLTSNFANLTKLIMMQHMFICDATQDIGNREISKLLIIDPNDMCIRNDGRKS